MLPYSCRMRFPFGLIDCNYIIYFGYYNIIYVHHLAFIMHEVQFMSHKAQFMKSMISIHADRQFIEFALQTQYTIKLNKFQQNIIYLYQKP